MEHPDYAAMEPDWDDDVPTSDEEDDDLGVPHTVEQDV